jgi:4-hydroxy-tetrahydrodipicolinate synthase
LIKLVQEEIGMGSSHVRPPRLVLDQQDQADVRRIVAKALQNRPDIGVGISSHA